MVDLQRSRAISHERTFKSWLRLPVKFHRSSTLEYYQDHMPLTNPGLLTFSASLGVTGILCKFRLVLEEEEDKET